MAGHAVDEELRTGPIFGITLELIRFGDSTRRFIKDCHENISLAFDPIDGECLPDFPHAFTQGVIWNSALRLIGRIASVEIAWERANRHRVQDGVQDGDHDALWATYVMEHLSYSRALNGARWIERLVRRMTDRWGWTYGLTCGDWEQGPKPEGQPISITSKELTALATAASMFDAFEEAMDRWEGSTEQESEASQLLLVAGVHTTREAKVGEAVPNHQACDTISGDQKQSSRNRQRLNRSERNDLEARALALIARHPALLDLPVKDLADKLECHPGSLAPSRMAQLAGLREAYNRDRERYHDSDGCVSHIRSNRARGPSVR